MVASPQDKDEPNMNGTAELNAPPKSTTTAKQILALVFTLAIGSLIGGYVTSSLLESEYQSILAQLRTNYQLSLSETKEEYMICREDLIELKKSYTEIVSNNNDGCRDEMKVLKAQWRHEELSCQQELEREMLWSHKAFEDSTAAITRATGRLQALKQEIGSVKGELVNKHAELEVVTSNLLSTQTQREEAQQKLDQTVMQLTEIQGQYEQTQNVLSTLTEELDRRDVERAECDKTHRGLDSCQSTLRKSLEGTTDGCTASLDLLQDEKIHLSRQLEVIKTQNENIIGESEFMKRRSARVEKQLEGVNALLREFETERDALKAEIETFNEKIRQRDRLSVLNRYGPGPHRIKFTIQIPSDPPIEETLILELAPLDLMPHTVKSVLEMVERETLVDGTIMLAKPHIILIGPVDYWNTENNLRLNERIATDGYGNGVLLFNEFTPEFPHVEGTVGFTPGYLGPVFYVNLVDNSEIHSASKDPAFGTFVKGFDMIQRFAQMPKREEDGVFDSPIYIVAAEILVEH